MKTWMSNIPKKPILFLVCTLPLFIYLMVGVAQFILPETLFETVLFLSKKPIMMFRTVSPSFYYSFFYYGYLILLLLGTIYLLFQKGFGLKWKIPILLITGSIFLASVWPYPPLLSAPKNGQIQYVTQPTLFEYGRRKIGYISESRHCFYTIHGWVDDLLYYKRSCGQRMKKVQSFSFDASTGEKIQIDIVPEDVYKEVLNRKIVRDLYPNWKRSRDLFAWGGYPYGSESGQVAFSVSQENRPSELIVLTLP